MPIFDSFLLSGWPSTYQVGVSLLNNFLQGPILEMEGMMQISQFMRDDLRKAETFSEADIHRIIMRSHDICLTKKDLTKYKDDFYVGLAR